METTKLIVALLLTTACANNSELKRPLQPVNFSKVEIEDDFWSPRLDRHKSATIPVCSDQIENQTGRMANFINAAKGEGKHRGIYFDDSDVYKALEGMAYSLKNHPDKSLEKKCDEWIDNIAAAQQKDGYLNTFYTLTDNPRWNDMNRHEMYCAGHMIEAAVAYCDATGKRKLLDVCCRFVDHMMDVFGPGKRDWVPGHEEIELALVKLYETTGEKKYLEFSNWLLEERGHGLFRSDVAKGFGHKKEPKYFQDDVPVSEITDVCGHAVRAMYLYCGMADVAACTGNEAYMEALKRVWSSVVERNMYVTGGIGASRSNEGFQGDFNLPNHSAYCETCASVGMVLWNQRMNLMSGDAKYIDVLERSLYNGALAGISLDGDLFFYVNPLESDGTHHRLEWYGCACCPSQLCRFLPSIGGYIYAQSKDAFYVNLYIGNESDYMSIDTDYPWDGKVELEVGKKAAGRGDIMLRIPSWCESYRLTVNDMPCEVVERDGYAVPQKRRWKEDDEIEIIFDMPAKLVAADPRVLQDVGKRAVQKGPLVYCLEEIDNAGSFDSALLSGSPQFSETFEPDLLGGVTTLRTADLKFIPYYAWDNRAPGRMKVWVDYQ